MIGFPTLWLPIVLSAVIVFLASWVLHMLLRYHWKDLSPIPGEDSVLETMRKEGVRPGDYGFPHMACPANMKAPETAEKLKRGPVGFMTVLPSGPPAMGRSLVLWFI
jgi:hypothetical protein